MRFVDIVRKLAEDYPNAVYRGASCGTSTARKQCFYTMGKVENGPEYAGCIIGQAIRIAKLDPREFDPTEEEIEQNGIDNCDCEVASNVLAELKERGLVDITDSEINWCRKVQAAQDMGLSWASAVKEADTEPDDFDDSV